MPWLRPNRYTRGILNFRPRLKLVHLVVAVLVLSGALPLCVYGWRLIQLNQEALRTKELEFQSSATRSLADAIALHYESSGDALTNLANAVVVLCDGQLDERCLQRPETRGLLQQDLEASNRVLYLSVVNQGMQGVTADRLPDADVFLQQAVNRAYLLARAGKESYHPVYIRAGEDGRAVMLRGRPIRSGALVLGAALQVENFTPIQARLDEMTAGGLDTFLVDEQGRLIAAGRSHLAAPQRVAGEDLSHLEIVRRLLSWNGKPRASETASYPLPGGEQMLGTYAAIPPLNWAVVVQRPERLAFAAAGEMEREGYLLLLGSLVISLGLGVLLAARLVAPLRALTEQTQALARRELQGPRTLQVGGTSQTEIGDLARNFNLMADEIAHYVAELKSAATANRELFLGSIRVLAQAVDAKDPYTRGHSDRVTRYAVVMARRLALSPEEVEQVRIAAQLHDVGKIGIDDRILKKPDALSTDEFTIMKEHTTRGANIVREIEQLHDVLPGIELHHEAVNGSGYPYGLTDAEIPLMAKIIAIADTYDAMTTERPYQQAMDPAKAAAFIQGSAGVRYAAPVVAAFVAAFEAGELATRTAGARLAAGGRQEG